MGKKSLAIGFPGQASIMVTEAVGTFTQASIIVTQAAGRGGQPGQLPHPASVSTRGGALLPPWKASTSNIFRITLK